VDGRVESLLLQRQLHHYLHQPVDYYDPHDGRHRTYTLLLYLQSKAIVQIMTHLDLELHLRPTLLPALLLLPTGSGPFFRVVPVLQTVSGSPLDLFHFGAY
jgi:hypothetical protein